LYASDAYPLARKKDATRTLPTIGEERSRD
jgi:hypothetical protein